jgi:hypothetical protein
LNTPTSGDPNFFSPKYNLYSNFRFSRRGVGNLISSKLQYTILKTYKDETCNIIGLKISISGSEILIISIYGPNTYDLNFFQYLSDILSENDHLPVICGGDWNLTFCMDDNSDDIDTFSMQGPPSAFRLRLLNEICDKFC